MDRELEQAIVIIMRLTFIADHLRIRMLDRHLSYTVATVAA